MIGNYPVNDDWVFVRQIEAFNEGIFTLSAELDPSFISQGFLGFLWSKLFGTSFLALQFLTFLVTVIALLGLVNILFLLTKNKKIVLVTSLVVLFNPIVFTSAFSFMTDNYFLMYFVWSIYFFVKYYIQEKSHKNVVLGSLFVILASLTRQVGILVAVAFILVEGLVLVSKTAKTKKNQIGVYLIPCLAILVSLITVYFWPRFGANRTFIIPEQYLDRVKQVGLSLHYFPVFTFPLLLGLKTNLKKRILVSLALIFVFGAFLYHFDFFPVGNVLFLEKLYTKSDFRSSFSTLDNMYFKLFLAVLLGIGITKLFYTVKRPFKLNRLEQFLLLTAALNFVVLFIASDYYERYLIPSFVALLLFFISKYGSRIEFSKSLKLGLFILIFISVALQTEASALGRIKWKQVMALSEETGLITQIYHSDTYINYAVTQRENDFTGLIDRHSSFTKKCFVREYTVEKDSKIRDFFEGIEKKLEGTLLENRRPYGAKRKNGLSRAKNNFDNLRANEEYFSLLFNPVGKQAFVASWCTEED